ncbi:TonB-dependent receptor plug domain-containing protein [Serratia marcescens]|uniref:TonB-dependent receptor plug domain-containing protein n=1 Tax=Serratia marcescens TaxID=615 RepID=UPI001F08F63B|nr:TonB-dependent receptor plug domain-containing protein [Serratia marcescens]
MKYKLSALSRAILLAMPVSAAPISAFADNRPESAADTTIQELPSVTVTADPPPIELVPASVAVIDAWDLKQAGITEMEQLENRVAGLSLQPFGQPGMNAPVMLGLTASIHSFSTSVLMLVDRVPTLTAQGYKNSFLDVNRVEVLRAPQCTLYGRNVESGVISLDSQPMDNGRDNKLRTWSQEFRLEGKWEHSDWLAGMYGDQSGSNLRNFTLKLTDHVGLRYDALQGWYAQASVMSSNKIYLDAAYQYKRNGYGLVNLVAG